jgi:uncharacterized protein YdeI (YjbR/CyaY-like superfamily)
MAELPVRLFKTKKAWAEWLARNHESSPGLRLKLAKKDSGATSITYAEAVEVALCYGWIDGQANRVDDRYWLQRFTPRRPRSKWSRINRDKAVALIEAGKMKPAGLRAIEAAKAAGRWDAAYAGSRTATVPDDLKKALSKNARARKFFETLTSANRYAILFRIEDAKKPETRARRIEKFVAMLEEHKTLH